MAGSVPWAILSAGVDHASFLEQVRIAVTNGASGVIAGRALWKDCISLDSAVSRERLTNLAVPRLRQIYAVLEECRRARAGSAPPWCSAWKRSIDVGGTNSGSLSRR
jgi:tagatose 1,6-diphosphate aldolase